MSDYRPHVPSPSESRVAGKTAREHAKAHMQGPRARKLFAEWTDLMKEPFRGITTDGAVETGLFSLRPEGAPTRTMAEAAAALLAMLPPGLRAAAAFPVDSDLWRRWQNTELHVEEHGIRLDEVRPGVREAVMKVVRASLSGKGYEISRNVMRLNRFLGDLVECPEVLGEWSYTFSLFGAPSLSDPWGWQLFGHHLSLNCFVVGGQMTLTPSFLGAEATCADSGPFAGVSVFEDEERAGLALMRSLSSEKRRRATVFGSMKGGDLPEGRWHFADHLHLGGTARDNRIVPYEGLPGTRMSASEKRRLVDLVATYLAPLPPGPLAARIDQVERRLDETHFCWIGGMEEESPFYYRIQSPVIFIEFDHHSGVFLTNREPAKFHVHTIVRTPNGNDYGVDLLRQHYAEAHRTARENEVARRPGRETPL